MAVVGDKVRVVGECYWGNQYGRFFLLGREGHVYDLDYDDEEEQLCVLIPGIGHVLVGIHEVELIE